MIIDSHVHIYPDKIAHKASRGIGDFYGLDMSLDGTVGTLLKIGDAAGVDRFLVHSAATTPHQVRSINSFISDSVKEHHDRFIGFATLHPDCEDIPEIVDEAISLGLAGIKLHPDFQEFDIDCPRAMRMYEAIEGKMPVLFHTGDYRTQYSKPLKIINVLREFPKLDVIAAHFGAWSEWGNGAKELAEAEVYVDTSSSFYAMTPVRIMELINIFGTDHIFFGSDYPMWNVKNELETFMSLPLSDEDREKILHLNLENLLAKYKK